MKRLKQKGSRFQIPFKAALVKDGWTITDDPLKIEVGRRFIYIDLGAQKLLGAQKQGRKIAVEIKSFISPSPVSELEKALGQYELYSLVLEDEDPDRFLYLAISDLIFNDFLPRSWDNVYCARRIYV